MEMKTCTTLINCCGAIAEVFSVAALFYLRDKGLSKIGTVIHSGSKSVDKLVAKRPISTGMWTTHRHTEDAEKSINELREDIKKDIDIISSDINNAISEINSIISATELENRETLKKSKKWLILIIAGFAAQMIAAVLNLA